MFLVSIASLNLSAISRSVDMFRCVWGWWWWLGEVVSVFLAPF